jgi:hypothetical protein
MVIFKIVEHGLLSQTLKKQTNIAIFCPHLHIFQPVLEFFSGSLLIGNSLSKILAK